MDNDITEYVKTCPQCLRFKAVPEMAELNAIIVTQPMELVHIDYLTIESKISEKDVNILIVTDHFTRCAQAYITHSQTASVVANLFGNDSLFIMDFQKIYCLIKVGILKVL